MKNLINLKIFEIVKMFWDKKIVRQASYFIFTILFILLFGYLGNKVFNIDEFLESYELKTYDLRFAKFKERNKINPKILILSIDNASLEILEEELGRWPWSRDVYEKTIKYITSQEVSMIDLDIMFVGYQKGFEKKDAAFAKELGRHDNVYVSMSFEKRDEVVNPPELPANLSAKLQNKSKTIDFSNFYFTYPVLIMDKIFHNTDNIGIINFMRDADNVARRSPTFFRYKDKFYAYMPFKLAAEYISKTENIKIDKYIIDENNRLILGNRTIPLDEQGNMIINWYGPEQTYEYVPFWKVYKSAINKQKGLAPLLPDDYFRDKVVLVGVTAISLYDIKTTPLSAVYPGVEIQATVFNNILDNKAVKRASEGLNLWYCILLAVLTGITVIKIRQPVVSTVISLAILASYIFFTSYMLNKYNLWIDILPQLVFMMIAFTLMFIIKYVLKSKDFEYTYKLATTDGLTNLYNHRYFQEHLAKCMIKADKNGSRFALILIDIDFFKKFNDTYGHQAGDEVLRQVGQTLRKSVKSYDLVARYGGEEMVIVLDRVHTQDAISTAQRICDTIAQKDFELAEGLTVKVTISLGVATYPIDGKNAAELIEFADQGLYRAKHNGRNQVGTLPQIRIIESES